MPGPRKTKALDTPRAPFLAKVYSLGHWGLETRGERRPSAPGRHDQLGLRVADLWMGIPLNKALRRGAHFASPPAPPIQGLRCAPLVSGCTLNARRGSCRALQVAPGESRGGGVFLTGPCQPCCCRGRSLRSTCWVLGSLKCPEPRLKSLAVWGARTLRSSRTGRTGSCTRDSGSELRAPTPTSS